MKQFLLRILVFLTPAIFVVLIGLLLPTTPNAAISLLMSKKQKDSLLENTPGPRIIFVGGSNLSFGLNSQIIKDSLKLNPINTAVHANIGVKFMMDNTVEFIRKGDVVVLVPEYSHYYKSLNSGSEELMRTIFDVSVKNARHFNLLQFVNILPFIPRYSITKYNPKEYLNIKESDVYSVNSFNEFGDTYTHWKMKRTNFEPYGPIKEDLNKKVISYIEDFNHEIKIRGGLLFISFPAFQEKSYQNSESQILNVESELKKVRLNLLGSPSEFKMQDSLMFNTPYHLNKKGVDRRTHILIKHIKSAKDHHF